MAGKLTYVEPSGYINPSMKKILDKGKKSSTKGKSTTTKATKKTTKK